MYLPIPIGRKDRPTCSLRAGGGAGSADGATATGTGAGGVATTGASACAGAAISPNKVVRPAARVRPIAVLVVRISSLLSPLPMAGVRLSTGFAGRHHTGPQPAARTRGRTDRPRRHREAC